MLAHRGVHGIVIGKMEEKEEEEIVKKQRRKQKKKRKKKKTKMKLIYEYDSFETDDMITKESYILKLNN